jgi:hypothetical protein
MTGSRRGAADRACFRVAAGVEMTKKTRERRNFAPVDRDLHDIIDELLRAMPPPKDDRSPRKAATKKTGAKRKRGSRQD